MSNELTHTLVAPALVPGHWGSVLRRGVRTLLRAAHEARPNADVTTTPDESIRRASFAVNRTSRAFLRIHGIDVIKNEPQLPPTVLFVANHLSYIDPFVIAERAPVIAIAKHELSGWPIVGRIAKAHGVIFVDRDDGASRVRALHLAEKVLATGTSVLNFPEGTTTAGGRMLRFQRGIFGVARRLRIPVVPVHIRYEDPDLAWTGGASLLPHYLRFARRNRTRVFVTTGNAIDPNHFDSAQALANFARWRIETLALISRAPTED